MYMVKNKGHSTGDDGYERLANAIILSACRDYSTTLRKLSRYKIYRDAMSEKESIEKFFRSGWFGVLTGIDPEMLIRKLQEEVTGV